MTVIVTPCLLERASERVYSFDNKTLLWPTLGLVLGVVVLVLVLVLKKIVRSPSRDVRLSPSWSRIKLQERVLEVLINLHDCGLVTASVTVIRRRENRHDVLLVAPVISLHDELMRACDEGKTVVVVKLLRDVLAKGIASTAGGNTPAHAVVRVRPQQIAHGTFVRDLLHAGLVHNVVEGVDGGGETTVETENLLLNQGSQRKVVEQIGEVLPHVRIAILSQALIIETIDLGNLAGLVVTTGNGNAFAIADLESKEERNSLHRVVTTINVVTHEQIVSFWRLTANTEEFN